MGFISGLKRAFGYNDNGLDDEDNLEALSTDTRTPYVNPFKKDEQALPQELEALQQQRPAPVVAVQNPAPAPVPEQDKVPEGVFDGILTIINGSVPAFVRDCIDVERERKAMYDALGPQFREYIRNTQTALLQKAREQWLDERSKLVGNVSAAEQRAEEMQRRATEAKEKLMSEERQRRAIAERANALEAKIADLEAGHEQDHLQCKSLVNKMKVMQVQMADAEADAQELKRVSAEALELRGKLAEAGKMQETIEHLTTENAALKQQVADLDNSEEIKALNEANKAKLQTAAALVTELRATVGKKDEELSALTDKLKMSADEIAQLQETLQQTQEELEVAAEVQEKVDQVGELIEKKDAEIARLRKQIAEAKTGVEDEIGGYKDQLKQHETERATMQKTISKLEADLAQVRDLKLKGEVELANRIDDLMRQLSTAGARLEEQTSEIKLLNAGKDSAEKVMNRMRADEMSYKEQIKKIKAELEHRDGTVAELRSRVAELMISLAESEPKASVPFDTPASGLHDTKAPKTAATAKRKPKTATATATEASATPASAAKAASTSVQTKVTSPASADNANVTEPQMAPPSTFTDDEIEAIFSFDTPATATAPEYGDAADSRAEAPVATVPANDGELPSGTGISAIDDIDDIDWLMPTPPSSPEPEAEPVPEEKPKPASSAPSTQMSLFD